MAADRAPREQPREFGVSEKPVGVKGSPVVVVAVGVGEYNVVNFTNLME